MIKNKTDHQSASLSIKPNSKTSSPSGKIIGEEKPTTFQSVREIFESLAIALFLAFLFKTFEAEAFVIPTGSMAPTLKGRHKDVCCQQCRFPFQVSSSEEIDSNTNRQTGSQVVGGTCPQCGFTQYFGDKASSYTGDRILVSKCEFDVRPPERWDVSVFRAPAEPRINFIKRIVGLPNEYLRIQYGDIFTVPKTEPNNANSPSPGEFQIARKPLKNLRQILQVVYDNDYSIPELNKIGWPTRWADDLNNTDSRSAAWFATDNNSFCFEGKPVSRDTENTSSKKYKLAKLPEYQAPDQNGLYWLRYRHIVPSSTDWYSLAERQIPPDVTKTGVIANNPQLITDQSAYNTGISRRVPEAYNDVSRYIMKIQQGETERYLCLRNPNGFSLNWTGDLVFSCQFKYAPSPNPEQDRIVLELIKGGQAFHCILQPGKGSVTLEIPGIREYIPETVSYPFKSGQKYKIMFMNVDEQLRLVINNNELRFPQGGCYDHLCAPLADGSPNILPRNRDPNQKDLTPVAVGVSSGCSVKLTHLKILRDIYYIADGQHIEQPALTSFHELKGGRSDRLISHEYRILDEKSWMGFLSDPQHWTGYGNTLSALLELSQGQFLALGDNSGFSLDSRLWESDTVPYYVDRNYMIGKAFYVYWPHGKNIPGTRLPFIPNFGKMRRID